MNLLITLAVIAGGLAFTAAVVLLIVWLGWRVPQCPELAGCTDDQHSKTGACDLAPGGELADRSFRAFIRRLRASLNTEGAP